MLQYVMTRINLVPAEDLTDQHLFSEFREIKMIAASLNRSLRTKSLNDVLTSIPAPLHWAQVM